MLLEAGQACATYQPADLVDLSQSTEGVIVTSQSEVTDGNNQSGDAAFFQELGKAVMDTFAALVQALNSNSDFIQGFQTKYLGKHKVVCCYILFTFITLKTYKDVYFI